MGNHPVAVLLSVYKNDTAEQFILAIQSILKQDYGFDNIHIYLGIDGQIPETIESYIEKYPSHFYKILRNEKNRGLAATLNDLIDALEEEKYAFRMDADDIALPYRFRLQVKFMEENPQVDICGGSIVEFDESGNVVMIRNYPPQTALAKKYICKAPPLAHVTVCFRKAFIKNPKYRYPRVKSSQDLRLWQKALSGGKEIANIKTPLVLVRMNNSMLKRRSIMYGIREFDAFLLATYSLHGINWRLIYPFARLLTRCMPSWINRILYRKLRLLLNNSKTGRIPLNKNAIQCVKDKYTNLEYLIISRRILKEICGLSKKEINAILSGDLKTKAA